MFTVPVPTGNSNSFQCSVNCSAGKNVLSGGYLLNGYAVAGQSSPASNSSWEIGVITNAASTMNLYVYAICALAHPCWRMCASRLAALPHLGASGTAKPLHFGAGSRHRARSLSSNAMIRMD
jgi:hypothetical protein